MGRTLTLGFKVSMISRGIKQKKSKLPFTQYMRTLWITGHYSNCGFDYMHTEFVKQLNLRHS